MRRVTTMIVAAVITFAALPAVSSASAPKRTVAQGWLGVDLDPADSDLAGVNVDGPGTNQLDAAAAAGVETIRFPIYWWKVQPYPSIDSCQAQFFPVVRCSDLSAEGPTPADAQYYYWNNLDRFIEAAATRGIRLMPSVLGAPAWATDSRYPVKSAAHPESSLHMPIPASADQYGAFVAKLASRYGSSGSFWSDHPALKKVPITNWQLWNEPDFEWYWPQHAMECVPTSSASTATPTTCPTIAIKVGRPAVTKTIDFANPDPALIADLVPTLSPISALVSAELAKRKLTRLFWTQSFLPFVKAARSKVKISDTNARIVLPSLTNAGWLDVSALYQAGAKGSFDALSANIFVATANIVKAIKYYRDAAAKAGDRNIPMYISEFSWSSGRGTLAPDNKMATIITDGAGQAKNLGVTLDSIVRNASGSKIAGAFWYRWASPDQSSTDVWDWTGLNKVSGGILSPKPALATFAQRALKLEGCKAKIYADACSAK